jgi:hypothetical protein
MESGWRKAIQVGHNMIRWNEGFVRLWRAIVKLRREWTGYDKLAPEKESGNVTGKEMEMRGFCVELPPSKLNKVAKISRVSFASTSSLRHRQSLQRDILLLYQCEADLTAVPSLVIPYNPQSGTTIQSAPPSFRTVCPIVLRTQSLGQPSVGIDTPTCKV